MFRATTTPAHQTFAAPLASLGYELREGQIRSLADGSLFNYFHSSSNTTNLRRKTAMHDAASDAVVAALQEFGVLPYNIEGMRITQEIPSGPHVRVLATDIGELKLKRDVLVVVPAAGSSGSQQQGGVWAFRSLLTEGGLEDGSVVGLARKLQEFGNPPGLVVLNPGELLYSHMENKPMGMPRWQSRERLDIMAEEYEVGDFNKVEMHGTENEHIQTMLGMILPPLLHDDCRIHLIAIEDSVKDTLDFIDWLYAQDPADQFFIPKLASISLIQPNHEHEGIATAALRDMLVNHGSSWVESQTIERGQIIAKPAALKAETMHIDTDEFDNVGDEVWVNVKKKARRKLPAHRKTHPFFVRQIYKEVFDEPFDATKVDLEGNPVDPASIPASPQPKPADDMDVDTDDEEAEPDLEVSASTFSAGYHDGFTELVFPAVIDHVLDFIQCEMMLRGVWDVRNEKEAVKATQAATLKDDDLPELTHEDKSLQEIDDPPEMTPDELHQIEARQLEEKCAQMMEEWDRAHPEYVAEEGGFDYREGYPEDENED